jgi:NADPH:quinone reductase-like Zn-dependent oxidoreductase
MHEQLAGVVRSVWPAVPDAPPATMHAVVVRRFGGPEVLEVDELPVPPVGEREVMIRVAAVSVGRLLDLTARAGTHPYARPVLPHTLGAEHAGTVAAVGNGVRHLATGDRVAVFPAITCGSCPACREGTTEACPRLQIIGVHRPGACAQYTVVPAANVHRLPADLDPCTAAGLALAGPVAHNQLTQAGLRAGDWVLVQGAASALGSLTAALALHLGARVIGTSRSVSKRERLLEMGLTAALDSASPALVGEVLALTGGEGVDVAVDNLGHQQVFEATMAVLGTRGTVVTSGAFLGQKPGLDLMRLYSRCQRIIGVRTGNARSAAALWREVDRGFRPVVDRMFPARRAADAHRYLAEDSNMGRVVLTTGSAEDWSGAR